MTHMEDIVQSAPIAVNLNDVTSSRDDSLKIPNVYLDINLVHANGPIIIPIHENINVPAIQIDRPEDVTFLIKTGVHFTVSCNVPDGVKLQLDMGSHVELMANIFNHINTSEMGLEDYIVDHGHVVNNNHAEVIGNNAEVID